MINIFDSANALAKDLTETEEYKAVQAAIAVLKENAADLAFYKEVVDFQQSLQMKQMQGQEITPEDDKQFEDYSKKMSENENIASLMSKEQAMYQLLQQVQQAMTRPLDELYADLAK